MKIRFERSEPPLDGVLRYIESQHSVVFDVGSPDELARRRGDSGVMSIAVGTLQVEIGIATRRALYVWGLHPRSSWSSDNLSPPEGQPLAVILDPGTPLVPGVSIAVAGVGEWGSTYDPTRGWLRVSATAQEDDTLAQIAEGTMLGACSGELHSIWLQPFFE